LKNIDVGRAGFEGLHQLRIFKDITPDVTPNTGIFVLLVNQQRRVADTKTHHPAWYMADIALDAVPIKFIDVDKVYYGLAEAKRMQAELEEEREIHVETQEPAVLPTVVEPVKLAARITVPSIRIPTITRGKHV
jgi:hypothetical protein